MSRVSACTAGHTVWYLKDEVVETWLQLQIDAGEWVKGKITCPHCNLRLGSFDFVTGKQCDCGLHVLPPIHIVKSRVDHENPQILAQALAQYASKVPDDELGSSPGLQSKSLSSEGFTVVTQPEVSSKASASLVSGDYNVQ